MPVSATARQKNAANEVLDLENLTARTVTASSVEIRLLGALAVVVGARSIEITGAKQRALLAMLALHANEIVSRDRLIDAAWGETPPDTVQSSLNVAISKLRRALGSDILETRPPGYVLRIDDDAIDLRRLERLVAEGRRALASGDPDRASSILRNALALARGAPLADFAFDSFAQAEIARLEELRLVALEERIDADLERGRHSVLAGELEALVARHPWRERLRAQLMLALYRAGRQREALEAYHETRRAFLEELAIEPSRELQRLQQAMLRQDAALDVAPAREVDERALEAPSLPGPRDPDQPAVQRPAAARLGLAVAGAAVLAAAVAALALVVLRSGSTDVRVPPNNLGVIDARSNRIVAAVPVGETPTAVTAGAGAIWVANVSERTVVRIDPATRTVAKRIGTGAADVALASGGGSVWALDRGAGELIRIDPRLNVRVGEPIRLASRTGSAPVAVAFGEGALWVELAHGPVLKVSPAKAAVVDSLPASGNGGTLAVGHRSVWVPSVLPNEVTRIDVASRRARPIPFERAPTAVAAGANAVWVAVRSQDQVWRIDPRTNSVTKTIPVGDGPSALAVGGGAVWVANAIGGTVSRIDPARNAVTATIEIGGRPTALAAGAGAVWVAVRAG